MARHGDDKQRNDKAKKVPRSEQNLKTTSLELPQEDWEWLSVYCVMNNISKRDLILKLLREFRLKNDLKPRESKANPKGS